MSCRYSRHQQCSIHEDLAEIHEDLHRLQSMLVTIVRGHRHIMSNMDDLNAKVDAANASLDEVVKDVHRVVADVQALRQQVQDLLDAGDTSGAIEKLNAMQDKLDALDQVAENASPEVVPDPEFPPIEEEPTP